MVYVLMSLRLFNLKHTKSTFLYSTYILRYRRNDSYKENKTDPYLLLTSEMSITQRGSDI